MDQAEDHFHKDFLESYMIDGYGWIFPIELLWKMIGIFDPSGRYLNLINQSCKVKSSERFLLDLIEFQSK